MVVACTKDRRAVGRSEGRAAHRAEFDEDPTAVARVERAWAGTDLAGVLHCHT